MLLSFLLSISFLSPSKDSAVVKKINAQMLHPRERIWAFPVNGVKIDAKEACLLWPATEGKTVEYKIALATDSLFTSNATFSDVQKWAVYPIHQQLQQGTGFGSMDPELHLLPTGNGQVFIGFKSPKEKIKFLPLPHCWF